MNFKLVLATLAIGSALSLPNVASADNVVTDSGVSATPVSVYVQPKEHTLFGKPVHLDLGVGTLAERVVGTDATHVSQANAKVSVQVRSKDLAYVLGTESYVSHAGVLNGGNSAFTGSLGLVHSFNDHNHLTIEGGNTFNDQQGVGGTNKNIPYVSVNFNHRVF